MIVSSADRDVGRLFQRQRVKCPNPRLHRKVLIELRLLDATHEFDELRVSPGNRLEALKGVRVGQHSIRINDQWRIRLVWTLTDPSEVEIADYH